jgi:hypothetical protein
MSPALQLNLGRRFGFSDWVDQAAHNIVHLPLASLTPNSVQLIGPHTTCLLIELHTKISHHRARTSLMLPMLLATHAAGCCDQLKCLAQWKDICLLLNKQIIRPGAPLTDLKLLEVMETNEMVGTLMAGMSAGCAKQVKEKSREVLVGKDAWLIDSIICQLMKGSSPGP